MNPKQRRFLWILPALIFLWIIYAATSICIYSYNSDSSPADGAIVLGAAIWDNEPSPVFEERINHAINLYQSGSVNKIIFTGGVGEGELVPESKVAEAYAFNNGVSRKDILCETRSKTTYENLKGAKEILDREKLGRVLIVSDPLHMKRAVTIARDLGIDAYPSPTPTSRYSSLSSKFGFLMREIYYYTTYSLSWR